MTILARKALNPLSFRVNSATFKKQVFIDIDSFNYVCRAVQGTRAPALEGHPHSKILEFSNFPRVLRGKGRIILFLEIWVPFFNFSLGVFGECPILFAHGRWYGEKSPWSTHGHWVRQMWSKNDYNVQIQCLNPFKMSGWHCRSLWYILWR